MIESISIAGTPAYGDMPQVLSELSQFNFLFGSNGTGKTTISRIIADEAAFPDCRVKWKAGAKLQALVYNSDFVERNFSQSSELKGVFTLGERQADAHAKIAAAKIELDRLVKKIETLTQGLEGSDGAGGKKGELAALEAGLRDRCWLQKQKHDAKLQGAFEGYRGSSEKFKAKILLELAGNSASLLTLSELEKKAESTFGSTPTVEQVVSMDEVAKLIDHESDPILKKRVIGKDDVDIAAIIKKLENSDWVSEGRIFYAENDGFCPFCQQSTTEAFAQSLNEYFDETFVSDIKAIDDLATNYSTEAAWIQQQIASLIAVPSRFLDVEKLKAEKELFDSKVTINLQRLAGKRKEASQVVGLEPLSNVAAAIKELIDSANVLVTEHNEIVANLSQERSTLTSQVWKYVLDELSADLAVYNSERENVYKAVTAMNAQIATATTDSSKKKEEIRELEQQTTSIQPTIDAINALLSSFGFQSFSLEKTASGSFYKLIRSDGSDAKSTLSEGEKNFVTFLYFYRLLKGSHSESGMTIDRVVVFDDPVSSLDSDILFVVGSLIKGLFEEIRTGSGHIKQVFVLTHNVYFHREISYNPKRSNNMAMTKETFWIVRKSGLLPKLEKHPFNPITTSYDLLWAEVRKPDPSTTTIQNTLRRILENYFKILGGIDPDSICSMFEGKDKLICRSLFSWVNAGSHHALDDLYVSIDEATVDVYLRVFREIFRESDHLAHYRMMMGDAYQEEPSPTGV